MKKLLILTTSTGQGHNQAADSISSTFQENGYEVHKHDFLENNSKVLNKAFVGGYTVSASSFPKSYGLFYKFSDMPLSNKIMSIMFVFARHKIENLINTINPDAILLTHPFAVNILGSLKRKGLKIPVITIVTDFQAHYTYIDKSIDAYITASNFTKKHLINRGISESKIKPFGIPVKDDFFCKLPELLTTRDNEYFNILLMSGSMGLENITYVLKELLNNSHKLRITIVCGTNTKLKDNLCKEYGHIIKDKKLHIIGFTEDVASLMDYSDLLITKPGGLTISEAIIKELPIIIPFVIPGQETQNKEFLTKNGYAYSIDNLLELNMLIDRLIDNPSELQDMKLKLTELSSTYSKKQIVNLTNNLIENK